MNGTLGSSPEDQHPGRPGTGRRLGVAVFRAEETLQPSVDSKQPGSLRPSSSAAPPQSPVEFGHAHPRALRNILPWETGPPPPPGKLWPSKSPPHTLKHFQGKNSIYFISTSLDTHGTAHHTGSEVLKSNHAFALFRKPAT